MRQSFHAQLADLKREIVHMGQQVSKMIHDATLSLAERDMDLAAQVIASDDEIDRLLIQVEKRSLQLMALQQPMARDLRTLGTSLKLVTDLERMADHATDIAEVTLRLGGEPLIKPLEDIPRMARLAQEMTRDALDAFVREDEAAVRAMIARDDEMDELYRHLFDEMVRMMQEDPAVVRQATYLIHVAMSLERIGDHATNIGEWTIYQLTGRLEELNN